MRTEQGGKFVARVGVIVGHIDAVLVIPFGCAAAADEISENAVGKRGSHVLAYQPVEQPAGVFAPFARIHGPHTGNGIGESLEVLFGRVLSAAVKAHGSDFAVRKPFGRHIDADAHKKFRVGHDGQDIRHIAENGTRVP